MLGCIIITEYEEMLQQVFHRNSTRLKIKTSTKNRELDIRSQHQKNTQKLVLAPRGQIGCWEMLRRIPLTSILWPLEHLCSKKERQHKFPCDYKYWEQLLSLCDSELKAQQWHGATLLQAQPASPSSPLELSAHLSPGPICCSLHSCSLLMLYPNLLLLKQVLALNSKSKCSKNK